MEVTATPNPVVGKAATPRSRWRVSQRVEENIEGSSKETLWIRSVAWALTVTATVYVLAFLRRSDLATESVWGLHIKGYLMLAAVQSVLVYCYRRMCDHINLGPGVRKLKTIRPNDEASPVKVTVKIGGVVTGSDEGYMWVQGETLYYKGFQTAFRINGKDILPLDSWPRKHRPNIGAGKLPDHVFLSGEPTQVVRFDVLDAFQDFNTRRRTHQLRLDLLRLAAERPNGELESLLPPADLHPALWKSGRTAWEPAVGTSLLTLTNVVLAVAMSVGRNVTGVTSYWATVATLVLSVLTAVTGASAWHCLKSKLGRERIHTQDRIDSIA